MFGVKSDEVIKYFDSLNDFQVVNFIYFDIDNFLEINGLNGHDVGDEILNGLYAYVKKYSADHNGFGARISGGSFLFILPYTSQDLSHSSELFEFIKRFRSSFKSSIRQAHRMELLTVTCIDLIYSRFKGNKRRGTQIEWKSGRELESIWSFVSNGMRLAKLTGRGRVVKIEI